jgi:hypothetical protein
MESLAAGTQSWSDSFAWAIAARLGLQIVGTARAPTASAVFLAKAGEEVDCGKYNNSEGDEKIEIHGVSIKMFLLINFLWVSAGQSQ